MLSEEFLNLMGELTIKEKRREASRQVAQLVGTTDLIFFVRDPEISVFVPAIGYPQVFPEGNRWQEFLNESTKVYSYSSWLPWPGYLPNQALDLVTGIASQDTAPREASFSDSVMVFRGKPETSQMLTHLIKLLPLLASCIRFELLALTTKTSLTTYGTEAAKTTSLIMQLEKTRQDLQQSLYHSQMALTARNEFMSVASHELKTPLQSIVLEVNLLKRSIEREHSGACSKTMERFKSLGTHLVRMTSLIDNLLDYSQFVGGKLIYKKEEVDLTGLVQEVVGRFTRQARSAGSSIFFEAIENVQAFCDRSKLDQVISNLISNAIKYGDSKDIHVGVSRSAQNSIFYVQDNGIGIPLSEQHKIFQRFERLETARDKSGFGLGLFVVKQIIDGHGGKVDVSSEPDQGTRFTVSIPTRDSFQEYV